MISRILLIFMLSFSAIFGQTTVDTVFSFTPGTLQYAGQSDEYFPQNIFGIPSRRAGLNTPENAEIEVLSIGLGGEIILGKSTAIIIDGPGPDFTIFENAFKNPINNKIFAEPAVISVSKDGINFIEFPYDYNSLIGCAGISPTYGHENPYDPEVSGGDSFDLSDIGIDSVKYIRIQDITIDILNDKSHPYYVSILSGFDLDAVVIHNYENNSIDDKPIRLIANNRIEFTKSDIMFDIYDLNGVKVLSGKNQTSISLDNLAQGSYFLNISNGKQSWNESIIIY